VLMSVWAADPPGSKRPALRGSSLKLDDSKAATA
jgi:hypothetical protein